MSYQTDLQYVSSKLDEKDAEIKRWEDAFRAETLARSRDIESKDAEIERLRAENERMRGAVASAWRLVEGMDHKSRMALMSALKAAALKEKP